MQAEKNDVRELRHYEEVLEAIAADREHVEARIRHLSAVLSATRKINRIITRGKDRNRLVKDICECLIEERGYHNAWIALFDASGKISITAEAGFDGTFGLIREKLVRGEFIPCKNRMLEENGIVHVRNPILDCIDCPVSHGYQGRGAMSTRLSHDGKVYGMLTVNVPEVFIDDPGERILLRDVADDIAFALHGFAMDEIRRKTEKELRKTRDDLEHRVKERTLALESLSSKILNAQEEERKRIAVDLHDGIGQSLSAVKFMVENIIENMAGRGDTFYQESLQKLVGLLREASEEVRTIVMNLRPSILDDLGLLATIGWLCRQFRNIHTGIHLEEHIDIREDEIADELKTNMFRILQEALNNTAKHSNADFVYLSLRKVRDCVELSIQDNGSGFDTRKFHKAGFSEKGFGLAGMKERTELSGGSFRICSAPGFGTYICSLWKIGRSSSH